MLCRMYIPAADDDELSLVASPCRHCCGSYKPPRNAGASYYYEDLQQQMRQRFLITLLSCKNKPTSVKYACGYSGYNWE